MGKEYLHGVFFVLFFWTLHVYNNCVFTPAINSMKLEFLIIKNN